MIKCTKEDIEKIIKEIIAEQLGLDAEKINSNKPMRELGVDSFGAVEFAFALKEKFAMEISERDFSDVKNVNDVTKYVLSKIKNDGNHQ